MNTIQSTRRTSSPTRWTVDRDRSAVDFAARTFWGMATVRGRFDRFDGSYDAGPDGIEIELTIDAESLDTGNATRDRHLRSADFFGVAEHPRVRFASTRVAETAPGTLRVEGDLTAAGKVIPLTLAATVRQAGGGLDVEATTTVDHRRFGMSGGLLGMIRPPVTLHVRARLVAGER